MNNKDKMKTLIETVDTSSKTKWAVTFEWSETEFETALVYANSHEEAEKIVRDNLPGIRWTMGARKINYEF